MIEPKLYVNIALPEQVPALPEITFADLCAYLKPGDYRLFTPIIRSEKATLIGNWRIENIDGNTVKSRDFNDL